MKRIAVIFIVILLTQAGCTRVDEDSHKDIPVTPEPIEQIEKEEVIKQREINRADFHFIVDWLTDSEILYVEKQDGFYLLKSFNISTGEMKIIYKEPTIIVDVFIHPIEDYLLLHTTENPTSATVKLVSLDGVLQNEVTIQSTELEIEWNDINPSYLLLTAFYEDWSFDTFIFDGLDNHLQLLSIEHPFPKWLGKDHFILTELNEHPLDGGKLFLYDRQSGENIDYIEDGVIYYDTFKDSLLHMRINENEEAEYTIVDLTGQELAHWIMPAVSNYSEWLMPNHQWIAENSVIINRPLQSGQVDELAGAYDLLKVIGDQEEILANEVLNSSIKCSPNTKKCLSGVSLEKIIDVENNEKTTWLIYEDEK